MARLGWPNLSGLLGKGKSDLVPQWGWAQSADSGPGWSGDSVGTAVAWVFLENFGCHWQGCFCTPSEAGREDGRERLLYKLRGGRFGSGHVWSGFVKERVEIRGIASEAALNSLKVMNLYLFYFLFCLLVLGSRNHV